MKFRLFFMGLLALAMVLSTGCTRVNPGEVGLKVDQFADGKGDIEILGIGRHYYNPFSYDVEKFPTTERTYEFENISFQSSETLRVQAPKAAVTIAVDPATVDHLWLKFKLDLDDLASRIVSREMQNAINITSSKYTAADVSGLKKEEFQTGVTERLRAALETDGLKIVSVQFTSGFVPPPEVESAIKAKVAATQEAEKRENDVRTEEAQAKIKLIQAQAIADATLAQARATAEANRLVSQSLTPEIVALETVNKWDGRLPQYSAGDHALMPRLNMGLGR